ncbi:hypothetical protein AGMMS50212_16600 [Spirochaetia bacterium]|nr:hypothetical protein AGMMS50212_16600 [Spirochaetia bacterium]
MYFRFDTQDRELIFYDENTQQVYNWLTSSPTRYGLYISSQNISVATLRRVMDIELESLDGIRMKVFEDVRMKIGINAPWDGSYRKASSIQKKQENQGNTIQPYIDDAYNSTIGIVRFSLDGNYTVELNGNFNGGKYVFFMLEGQELLELLPDQKTSGRETYRVIRNKEAKDISLIRIRLTTKGAQEFHESEILLTKVSLQ